MPDAPFQCAAGLLTGWRDDVVSGRPPTLYSIGLGELARIEVGPGLVTLIGGAPGAGKTAFTMQAVLDALRLTPELRAVVCNVEMSPSVLLDRQLARLSGVDLRTIRYRQLRDEHRERIDRALATLEPLAERLAFCKPPFTLQNVGESGDAFGADMLLLDYIQRIPPPGDHGDKRSAVDATMDCLRKFADQGGCAVIVVSAVSRGRDSKGRSSYAGDALSLASFRESSELEFGCDDAFILAPGRDDDKVMLRHLKARHGEAKDMPLTFSRAYQRFAADDDAADADAHSDPAKEQLASVLDALWAPSANGSAAEADE